MEIEVVNNFGNIEFEIDKIIEDIRNVVYDYFKTEKSLTLILVNLEEIHQINLNYRHVDRPTDVISFEEFEEDYLGEIFVCIEKVYEQAKLYEHSVEREMAFLLVHGLLHLHGYDHIEKEDEETMFALQDELLAKTIYSR
jgi:probable rRNA maturation factor